MPWLLIFLLISDSDCKLDLNANNDTYNHVTFGILIIYTIILSILAFTLVYHSLMIK